MASSSGFGASSDQDPPSSQQTNPSNNASQASSIRSSTQAPNDEGPSTLDNLDEPQVSSSTRNDSDILDDDLRSIATPELMRLPAETQLQPSSKCNVECGDRDEYSFECEYCHKRFARDDLLLSHSAWAHVDNQTDEEHGLCPCDECAVVCVNEEARERHKNREHAHTCTTGLPRDVSSGEGPTRKYVMRFRCQLCIARFRHQEQFDRHMRSHERNQQRRDANSPTRGFSCQVCDLEFRDEEVLRRHAMLHTHKLICLTCDRRFEHDSDLTAHVLTEHPSEEVRRPDVPQFVASGGDAPRAKRRATSEAKPICGDVALVCQWPRCGKAFTRVDSVARHRKSHTGMEEFPCRSCDKKFLRKDTRVRHEKCVHEKKGVDGNGDDDSDRCEDGDDEDHV